MKKIIVLLSVFLISGCSTKFAYKNIDWLIHWYVDDYVEMTSAQEEQFDQYVAQWQQWHMQNELPIYQAHLEELMQDIRTQNISIERMDYHQQKAQQHWLRFRAHIAPGVIEMAKTLDDDQVTYFFAALENENVEDEERRAKRLERSESKRKSDWIERNEDNIENWLGRLNQEQKRLIENTYGTFKSNSQYWVSYKRDYQQAMRAVFAAPDRGEVFTEQMLELIINPERFRSEQMLMNSAHNERETKLYLYTLFALSTEKQRAHLIDEVDALRDDVVELSQFE